ncbi:hypothetical protein K438DRAFT_1773205 [Mycena galopus ATCC 62051]|nr:hypothetical protein K438DRAFT_1773205 [Mycena galopus ATCC 62051]
MDADAGHEAHAFFMECNQISNKAQCLMDALPNVETAAVERLHHQLNAIKVILLDLNDPADEIPNFPGKRQEEQDSGYAPDAARLRASAKDVVKLAWTWMKFRGSRTFGARRSRCATTEFSDSYLITVGENEDNHYILLSFLSSSGIVYIVNGQRPAKRLTRLENAIKSAEGTLKHAKKDCMRNHLELVNLTSHFFKAKLLASKIQMRILEPHSATTWKEFAEYLQNAWEIMRDILQCAKKVKEIRISTLCIMEGERQHQFSVGIQESREILETVTSSLARLTSGRRRGYVSATRDASYDSV